MNGHVDSSGRALIAVRVWPPDAVAPREIEAWIDTAFNGDLVLPQRQIDELSLPESGTVAATLADGSEIILNRYACLIDWFGERRDLEVVANEGERPLLGIGLLLGRDLHINYRLGKISID